jgi:pyridoxal phosphate enzyme (YggS family)
VHVGQATSTGGIVSDITARVRDLLHHIPAHVTVIAVCKGRSTESVSEAVDAGIGVIGQNYMVDARRVKPAVAGRASVHLIGRMRPHDVRLANLKLFDMVQSVDSLDLATRIDRVSATVGLRLPVLIEVNSGREPQKGGVVPESVEALVRDVSRLTHVEVAGLMTMGPLLTDPARYHPYFRETQQLFRHLQALDLPGVSMVCLSMGTSDSFEVAIEDGATMVRLGTAIFGPR